MLGSVVEILTGLVLLTGAMRLLPRIGPGLEKFARWLGQFDIALGIIAMVVGLLGLFSLEDLLLILGGLILAASGLRSIPSIGKFLERLGTALASFRLIVGLLLLIVGLLGILFALVH
jgi:hypothetical protein